MNSFRENTDKPMDDNPAWGLFEDNYNKYYLEYKGDKTPVIPKNIHFIWLGGPIPQKYKRLQDTWRKHHPTWNIKIWNDRDAQEFGMVNKLVFDCTDNLGIKSDIFRYEILYRHGGIYVDTDYECFKPFDDLLYLDFFAGGGWNEWPVVFNGLLACTAGNKYMKLILKTIYERQIPNGTVIILEFSGCDFITPLYVKYLATAKEKTVIFPNHFFYPMPADIRLDVREDNEESRKRVYSYIKPNSYCVHLFYCSWQ
jgi:inositol phosphorylceramide mannosyltransferase catalytic subunit